MKEAIVSAGPKVEIKDSDIPTPSHKQVLTKVVVSGSNPKDWKYPEWTGKPGNLGDDIAGIVEAVGSDVYEFKKGDRVAGFHTMLTPGGSYAEYAISEAHATIHIPNGLSFEEAATLPLAALTSAIALHVDLKLPPPWAPATDPTPLLVYGGASAIGAFAIKLARLANIHPIVAVAGRAAPFVEGLLDASKGDAVVDYRDGDDAVVQGLKDAFKGAKVLHAYDAVSEKGSTVNVAKVLAPGATVSTVLPVEDELPEHVTNIRSYVGQAQKEAEDFAFLAFRYIAKAIQAGSFTPHPHEVRPGGLNGIEGALKDLKEGKASGVKYVFRIADT